MKRSLFFALGLLGLVLSGLGDSRPADACSSSTEVVAVSTRHPDLPLTPFVAGRLGVLQPSYARAHLVVAYAWLSGVGLDAAAQRAILELAQRRLAPVDAAKIAPGVLAAAPPDTLGAWQKDLARVLAGQGGGPRGASYTTPTYVTVDNCLADAFRVARDTLLEREATLGARAPDLIRWTDAQKLVFANCADPARKAVPAPLPASASASAHADRAYQIASAYFYANQFNEAERRFRLIAADRASPWSARSGYMLARVRVRRASLEHDPADAAELGRALAEVDAQLHDPARATMHASLRRYRGLVRARVEPKKLVPELAAKLAAGGLGAETGAALDDYTTVLDLDEGALERGPLADDLTTFLGAVQGKRSFELALARHTANPASEVWLVAALMTATHAADPRVGALVQDALALGPSAPGYATARFHAIRLSAARGATRPALTELLRKTRAGLGSDLAPSTRNAFAGLAARLAPDLATFLREAPIVPAGGSEDSGPVLPDPHLTAGFPPELADSISAGLPLSGFKDAALTPALATGVRAHFAATAWARAHLLGDRATAAAVAPTAGRLNPALQPYVARVEQARGESERRLGLVHTLLKFPALGPGVDGWASGPSVATGVASGSGFWCPREVSAPRPDALGFTTAAERDAARKELVALDRLGAGPTWLAFEAARVAALLPHDPRAPEALHLAVRATRYGCKDGRTSEASRRAFQALHRRFPDSRWAKATPYHF